jgi:hypothetical protein
VCVRCLSRRRRARRWRRGAGDATVGHTGGVETRFEARAGIERKGSAPDPDRDHAGNRRVRTPVPLFPLRAKRSFCGGQVVLDVCFVLNSDPKADIARGPSQAIERTRLRGSALRAGQSLRQRRIFQLSFPPAGTDPLGMKRDGDLVRWRRRRRHRGRFVVPAGL